jgi:hypothetical protein
MATFKIQHVLINKGILEKFEVLLNTYLHFEQLPNYGHPKVSHFEAKLNITANYFVDLVKKLRVKRR